MSSPSFIPEHEFDAQLELDTGDGGGVYVIVPFSVPEVYGTRGQVKVQTTIDGFPYQGSLTPVGDGHHALPVLKAIRGAIGKTWGEWVHVTLARDTAPRTVVVPADLARALAATPGVRERFDALAYTHQKEFVRWIEGAKKAETRERRLAEAVAMIQAGRKRS